jgi:polysaccharide export outer membrane protein
MLSRLSRFLIPCLMLAMVACASNQTQNEMPIPSAARGGVQPPGEIAQPMRHAAPIAAMAQAPAPAMPEEAAPVPVPAAPKPALVPAVAALPATAAEPTPPVVATAASAHMTTSDFNALSQPSVSATPVAYVPPANPPASMAAGGDYVLGTGDEVRLTVYGEDDLSGQYTVGSTGVVALPLVGNVDAAGHTVGQFEAAVRAKLVEGYIKDPRVSAQVVNYRPFFILGEVAKPGSYPYVNGMTVLSAVATAGGYTYRADHGDIRVIRASDPSKTEQDVEQNGAVMPGDIVRVTERFF